MVIYRCDRCGVEKRRTDGIVGHEFDHGFCTLAAPYRMEGVVDVCRRCLGELQAIGAEARREKSDHVFARLRAAMRFRPLARLRSQESYGGRVRRSSDRSVGG